MSLVAVLLACGGDTQKVAHPKAKPTVSGFTATPATLPYGGGSVTLSWIATEAASLAISPDVGDVTGKTSAVVNVTASKTFTLTASNPVGTATATAAVSVATTISLSGHTVTTQGYPLPNAIVLVVGRPQVVSDAQGAFTVPDVTPPYTAAIVDPSSPQIAVTFVGLTTTAPVLGGSGAGMPNHATVAGTVSGGTSPYSSATTKVLVSFAYAGRRTSVVSTGSDGQFAFDVVLPPGQTSVTGQLAALETCSDAVKCTAPFLGYAQKDGITLTAGTPLTGQAIALEGVLAANISGGFTATPDFTFGVGYPVMTLLAGHQFSLPYFATNPWTVKVPVIAGAQYAVTVTGTTPTADVLFASSGALTAGQTGASFAVDSQPVDTLFAASSNVSSLSWTGPDVSYGAIVSAGSKTIVFYTNEKSLAFPDLSPIGFALAPGTPCSSQLLTFGPKTSMDLIAPSGLTADLPNGYIPPFLEINKAKNFVYQP